MTGDILPGRSTFGAVSWKNFALGMAVSYCFAVLVVELPYPCLKNGRARLQANWASDFARPKVRYYHGTNGPRINLIGHPVAC